MSTQYLIRARLTILFFTLLSLAVAVLNSATARFSIVLRDRARSDYINTGNGILNNNFQKLQSNVLVATALMAIATTASVIYGIVIAAHPRWVREHDASLYGFTVSQFVLAFGMIVIGGYLADHVQGFDTSFEKFASYDSIPYYSFMYYGGIAQAAYGSTLVFLTITAVVLFLTIDHYQTKRYRVEQGIGLHDRV